MWFAEGVAGRSWQAQPQTSSYLDTLRDQQLFVPGWQGWADTVAAWLKPDRRAGRVRRRLFPSAAQYRIARYPDGTLRWAFNHTTGFNWVNTGVVIPGNLWSHVAVTYDAGLVKTLHQRPARAHAPIDRVADLHRRLDGTDDDRRAH